MKCKTEFFYVRATRCKRCGVILLNEQSQREGYGHSCKTKIKKEERRRAAVKNQISLFEVS